MYGLKTCDGAVFAQERGGTCPYRLAPVNMPSVQNMPRAIHGNPTFPPACRIRPEDVAREMEEHEFTDSDWETIKNEKGIPVSIPVHVKLRGHGSSIARATRTDANNKLHYAVTPIDPFGKKALDDASMVYYDVPEVAQPEGCPKPRILVRRVPLIIVSVNADKNTVELLDSEGEWRTMKETDLQNPDPPPDMAMALAMMIDKHDALLWKYGIHHKRAHEDVRPLSRQPHIDNLAYDTSGEPGEDVISNLADNNAGNDPDVVIRNGNGNGNATNEGFEEVAGSEVQLKERIGVPLSAHDCCEQPTREEYDAYAVSGMKGQRMINRIGCPLTGKRVLYSVPECLKNEPAMMCMPEVSPHGKTTWYLNVDMMRHLSKNAAPLPWELQQQIAQSKVSNPSVGVDNRLELEDDLSSIGAPLFGGRYVHDNY